MGLSGDHGRLIKWHQPDNFAFVERSRTMKAPVGLLSDRTVLRSKMEGLCPDKFRVVELSRVYHTIPQSASKTKKNHRLKSMALFCGWRMTHPGLHFSSSCEFPKCSCWSTPAPNPARNEYGKLEVVCLVHYFNHLLNKPFSVFHIISFFIDDNFP